MNLYSLKIHLKKKKKIMTTHYTKETK